jgi:outer membrane receptor protein involved in Fe transport
MTGRDRSLRLLNTYSQTFFEKIDFIAGVQYDYANIIPAYANDYVFGQPLKYTGNVRQKIEDTITINEQKLGFFSQVRINFSKKINLTAGARYEVSKMFDEAFIPRLALVAKPNQSLTLKAMYAFAFQAPSFFYLYEQFGNVNTIMIPNTKQDFLLNNQKVQTVDFEFAYTKANFYLSGNVFLSKASDLIERRLYTQAVYNPYAGRETPGLRNENIGEQSIHGFMLRSSFRAGKTINFTANYIFTKATFLYGADRAKTLVPRISEHKIYAGIDFFKITGLFNLSAHWQYLPKLNPIASAGKDGKIEGHHFLNFSLATAKYRNIRFFANTQHMLGNKEHVGIFDGGIYMPVIPQAAFRGQIGIEIGL